MAERSFFFARMYMGPIDPSGRPVSEPMGVSEPSALTASSSTVPLTPVSA